MSNRWPGGVMSPYYSPLYPLSGQIAYTVPGSFYWTCPPSVTSVSVVCIGGGGGGGQVWSSGGSGGGGLGYKNNIAVVPGQQYLVVVGAGGACKDNATTVGSEGGNSYFISTGTVCGFGSGRGGTNSTAATPGYGGGYTGDGGGRGGNGAVGGSWTYGGAGAGGYGGAGADSPGNTLGTAGTGGSGAAAGYYSSTYGTPGGGGVGILGQGTSGAAAGGSAGAGGGSGGTAGASSEPYSSTTLKGTINGGLYGGGAGGAGRTVGGGYGGSGAVRIVWGPTTIRNPFFDKDVSSWGLVEGTASYFWDSTNFHDGAGSMALAGGSSQGIGCIAIPVTVGKVINMSAWVRSSAAAASGFYVRYNYSSSYPTGDYVTSALRAGYTDLYSNAALASGWQQVSGSWTVSAGVAWISLSFYHWGSVAQQFNIDSVLIDGIDTLRSYPYNAPDVPV